MSIWGQASFFHILLLVMLSGLSCSTPAPQIAGTWSGPMMIDGGSAGPTFVTVAVTFTQDGDRVGGSWRSLDPNRTLFGDVSGTVTGESGRHDMTVRFTLAGRHPIESTGNVNCNGAARSEGQLTYNTTYDIAGQPSPERPGWGIRLKAFEGFTFDSCPAIRYATWTLTRQDGARP